jgi:hypothetical protein
MAKQYMLYLTKVPSEQCETYIFFKENSIFFPNFNAKNFNKIMLPYFQMNNLNAHLELMFRNLIENYTQPMCNK